MMRNILFGLLLPLAAYAAGVPYMTQPALSPSGSQIAFVSGGDIWIVNAQGGEAHLLVSNPAAESSPMFSPDGKQLAFVSTRTGGGDIYILSLATDELRRLTFSNGLDQLNGWSRDGKWIYFSNNEQDVGRKNDIYRVSATGGTPMPVTADRFTNEFDGAPSPDGAALAFSARGDGDSQWWRRGSSHLDESEIWLRHDGSAPNYTKIVDLKGRNLWPMWTPDGHSLYFMSDRSGAENIWEIAANPNAKPRQVTKFTTGRVLWPSIGYDGHAVVFERDFRIWKLDTKTGEAFAAPITLNGAGAGPDVTHLNLTQYTDLALSPDGRKMAFAGHGEIFAASAREGGAAIRVTNTPNEESQVAWSPDSTRIIYASNRNRVDNLFLYDFVAGTEKQLTRGKVNDRDPHFSPDGKEIAFERDRRELRVMDMDSGKDRVVASTPMPAGAFAWSPDGKWLVYAGVGERNFRNLYIVGAAGGAVRPATFVSNSNVNSVAWSPDGKFLIFETGQRTETPMIGRVDLTPEQPIFHEDEFKDLFKPEAPRAGRGNMNPESKPKPVVEIDFDGIRDRLKVLPVGLEAAQPRISPDGKTLLFAATVANQQNLYVYSLDETRAGGGRGGRGGGGGAAVARQLTSTAMPKRSWQFSPDSKEVFYLEGGRIQTINLENKQTHPVSVTAEMDVDFSKEKIAVFDQVWETLRDVYYDPEMHGVNWTAIHAVYAPVIEGTRTPDEMRDVLRLMIGELNSSHSGISAPPQGAGEGQGGGRSGAGAIGLSFDRAAYENSGVLKITDVLPQSPAELAKIKVGEELRSVNGTPVGKGVNLDELLEHTTGQRVVLNISGHDVVVRPVNSLAEQIYRKWVEDNRAYVAKISNGRLGYIHMRDMSAQALTQMYMDLDAENQARDGVVIDIRNNNGGFVNAYALDVLTRRPYLTMTPRGMAPVPARIALGQRSLERPTILVTNQHSLSDAEDFTEGYRAMKLGKVVGEPTAGWIIYTSSATMVDGSALRTPNTRITDAEGRDMEGHPRPVDVEVTRPIGESYTGKDSQLDVAVRELLAQIGPKQQ